MNMMTVMMTTMMMMMMVIRGRHGEARDATTPHNYDAISNKKWKLRTWGGPCGRPRGHNTAQLRPQKQQKHMYVPMGAPHFHFGGPACR